MVQVAAVFVVHDVGVQQLAMLPSSAATEEEEGIHPSGAGAGYRQWLCQLIWDDAFVGRAKFAHGVSAVVHDRVGTEAGPWE